jgi:hypothetical protein
MSLKIIHLLFIGAATLVALGFGAWCLQAHLAAANVLHLALGMLSFAAGVGLVVYGRWFVRKLKGEGLL